MSSTEPEYKHRTLRFLQTAYVSPDGPPPHVEEVTAIGSGTCEGRFQVANAGSYARIESLGLQSDDKGLRLSFYAQPWMAECEHVQTFISSLNASTSTGAAVVLSEKGTIDAWIGTDNGISIVSSGTKPTRRRWAKIDLEVYDNSVRFEVKPVNRVTEPAAKGSLTRTELKGSFRPFSSQSVLLLAASQAESPTAKSQHHVPLNKFNGRLDTVIVEALGPKPRVLAHYDFSVGIPTDFIYDMSGNRRTGILVNAPSRAMTGYNWDGSETDWTKAEYGYGAIHFHEDDLDDAEWETDFSITIPQDARSGVYGVKIEGTESDVSDTVVFYVRPTEATTTKVSNRSQVASNYLLIVSLRSLELELALC